MINEKQTKYPALVKDNNDTDKLGRVMVYVEPLMHGWNPSDYPWAFQCKDGTGGSSSFGSSEIPEVGTWIWVWHEKANYKNWFYGEDVQWKASPTEEINPHTLFEDNVKSTIGSVASYPDVKFDYYKNGVCTGVSSGSSKEAFIYHPSGTFVIVENDGTVQATMASGKKFKVSGDVEITGDVKVTGKIDATDNISSDKEVTAMNTSPATKVTLSQHLTPTSVPGPPSVPQAGT